MYLGMGLAGWARQGRALAGDAADDMMTFDDAVVWVKRAVARLIAWGLVTWGFSWFHLSWVLYGAVTGLAAGLLAGCVVLITIPQKLQLAAVGAITGMGVDWVTSLGQKGGPKTAINTLATAIANAIAGIMNAAETTSLPVPPRVAVAYGLWCFVFGLGLVMLLGSMQKRAK